MRDFYTRVVNCTLTNTECPYALKNPATGDIPRGFSVRKGTHPDILFVRKNPGHADNAEKEYYRGKHGKSLFRAVLHYRTDHTTGKVYRPKGSNRFWINERRYLLFILGVQKRLKPFKGFEIAVDEREEISRQVFFTNLFKCSTEDEQAKIPDRAFSVCYKKYFLEELRLIRPRLIVAAGREVYNFLRRREKAGEIVVPILYVKHPSYFYSKGHELHELKRIRRLVQGILKTNIAN